MRDEGLVNGFESRHQSGKALRIFRGYLFFRLDKALFASCLLTFRAPFRTGPFEQFPRLGLQFGRHLPPLAVDLCAQFRNLGLERLNPRQKFGVFLLHAN